MVDALNNARRMLGQDGVLLDIHPAPDRPFILCEVPDGRRDVGKVRGGRRRYREVDERLKEVVQRDLFRSLRTEMFHVLYYAPSLRILREHLARDWTDASMDDATARRIRDLLGHRGIGTLIIDVFRSISILQKV